jgi:hypothetical protein
MKDKEMCNELLQYQSHFWEKKGLNVVCFLHAVVCWRVSRSTSAPDVESQRVWLLHQHRFAAPVSIEFES